MYTDKLEIHILELPKLAEYEYPENELLDWVRFINAEQKCLEYEAREKAIRDHNYLIKSNREEGMKLGILARKAESIMDLLNELGPVPDSLKNRIASQSSPEILSAWLKMAARAESIEIFEKQIDSKSL